MIDLLYIKIFLFLSIILYLIGFITPLILIHRKGKDPHGIHKGYSILAKFSAVTILIWLGSIIWYICSEEVFDDFWMFTFLSGDFFIIVGMLIVILGFMVEFMGVKTLGLNFRIEFPKEETDLVTSGIYSRMRNPIVLGVYLLLIGIFFIIPNAFMLIVSIANIVAFDGKARDEEKFLLTRFGKTYEEYKKKVGRYFTF